MNADKTRIAYPSSSAFIGGQFLLSSVLARESGGGGAIGASGFAAFADGLLKFFGYGAPVFVAVSVGEGEWENRELRQVRDLCIFDAAFRFYESSVLLSCGHMDTRIVRVSARMHKVEPYATPIVAKSSPAVTVAPSLAWTERTRPVRLDFSSFCIFMASTTTLPIGRASRRA